MKGYYHHRLRAALAKAVKADGIKHASLAAAIESTDPSGSGVGKYLRGSTAGAMDLDEADKALRHCGLVGLKEWIADARPPETGVPPRVIAFLAEEREFRELLADLLEVPHEKLGEVLLTWQPIVRGLRKKPRGGSKS